MSDAIDLTTNDAAIIIDQVADQAMGRPLRGYVPTPSAEDAGDVLTAGDDGTYSWEPVNALPEAEEGDAGKILTLDSDLDPIWETPEKELPAGEAGDASKVLTLNVELEPTWALIPRQLPDVAIPEDTGKVLTVGDSSIVWAQPTGQDLYWHTVAITGGGRLAYATIIIINTTAANITLDDIKGIINAGGLIAIVAGTGTEGSTKITPVYLSKHSTNPDTIVNLYYMDDASGSVSTGNVTWTTLIVQSFGTDSHKIN